MKSIIAENVKQILKARGLKQGAVGKLAGYDIKVFNNMLNSRKVITDIDVLKISKVLEVSPNVLFGIEDKKVV